MRAKTQPQKFTEVEENEQILKARQELLSSAEEEQRRLEALRFQQKETQELIDVLQDKEKSLSMTVQALENRLEQLRVYEAETTGKVNVLTGDVNRLSLEQAKLVGDVEVERRALSEAKQQLSVAQKALATTQIKEGEVSREVLKHKADVDTVSRELQKKRADLSTLEAQIQEFRQKGIDEERLWLEKKSSYDRQEQELVSQRDELLAKIAEIRLSIAGTEKELDGKEDELSKVIADIELRRKQISEENHSLDVRAKTLAAIEEALRTEAIKIKSKDLDKKIAEFIKGANYED